MKIKILCSGLLGLSGQFLAGGTSTGGTPPAREQLLLELSGTPGHGGLFQDKDLIGLGINGKLRDELTLGTKLSLQRSFSALAPQEDAIAVPEADLQALSARESSFPMNITAENMSGEQKAYQVQVGDEISTIVLKDRRLLLRNSVAKDTSD
jgi:hypothetical protein